jgi:hypothetical protein
MSPQYNVDEEVLLCLEVMFKMLDFLADIRIALELRDDLGPILWQPIIIRPVFDPLLTITS